MCPFHYNLPTGSGENDDASPQPGASFPSPEVELSLSDLNIWEAGAVPTQGAKRAIPRRDGRGTGTGRALTFPPELKILLSPRGARTSSPMGEKTNSRPETFCLDNPFHPSSRGHGSVAFWGCSDRFAGQHVTQAEPFTSPPQHSTD